MRHGRLAIQKDSQDEWLGEEVDLELDEEGTDVRLSLHFFVLRVFKHLVTLQVLLRRSEVDSISCLHE